MAISNDLSKDINAIKDPHNRLLIRALAVAVATLFSGIMLLYRVGLGDKKSAVEEAKEQTKIYKAENDYLKIEIIAKGREIKVKDSLYNDCGTKRLSEAKETNKSISSRIERNYNFNPPAKKR